MQAGTSPALREQRLPRLMLAIALSLLFSCGVGLGLLAGDWMTFLFFGSYALAGSLLVVRRPRNVIGWLLVTIGWVLGVSSLSIPAPAAELKAGGAPFGAELLAWATVAFTAIGATALPVLALVFPSGRLPSGRWRLAVVVAVLVALAFGVAYSFAPTLMVTPDRASDGITVPNPFAILPDLFLWQFLPPFVLVFLYILLLLAAGAVAMVVRYRRASGVERLQLRWVVAALGFVAVATVGGLFATAVLGNVAFIPATVAFPSVPAAITVAVLRYRLYEIDLLVNRTLVYGTAAALVAAAFALANIGAQRVIEALTHQRSDLVTGALVVVAALAFGPTLRLVRPIADRLLPRRAILTLLFTDIVESTRKAVELGDEAWRELLSRYRSMVRRELTRTGGHEVDTAGDGFFATFDRPDAGLRCAWQLRAGANRLGLETRSGLHVGECETRGEKVTGVAVHVAARVMSLAGPGEILMSDAQREAVSREEISLRDRGRHELKGVPGEWQLYGVQELKATKGQS
ncbi:MAG: adenylate/guanylate cyclase domain-containing protein [Chloroflexota bacterium]|nr:adenylate/guanylate cyclase domain-containing protein [Chloroflexota bacterium]